MPGIPGPVVHSPGRPPDTGPATGRAPEPGGPAGPDASGRRAPSGPARLPDGAGQAVGPKGSLAPPPHYLRLAPTAPGRCFLLDPLGLPPPLTASPLGLLRRYDRWLHAPGRLGLGAPYVMDRVGRQMAPTAPDLGICQLRLLPSPSVSRSELGVRGNQPAFGAGISVLGAR